MGKPRILVVDDSKLSAKMIEDRLAASGFQVDVAFSAEEAIANLSTPDAVLPDLVISDVVMPGMSGIAPVAIITTSGFSLSITSRVTSLAS